MHSVHRDVLQSLPLSFINIPCSRPLFRIFVVLLLVADLSRDEPPGGELYLVLEYSDYTASVRVEYNVHRFINDLNLMTTITKPQNLLDDLRNIKTEWNIRTYQKANSTAAIREYRGPIHGG